MMLRKKLLAAFAATVLALSMMVGSAMAQTDQLPFDYANDAGVAVNNDVWVVLFGGTAGTPITDDTAVRDAVVSVDVIITGKATFDGQIVANCENPGWTPTDFPGESVDGETTLSIPLVGKDNNWVEVVVNLANKSEGPLQVTRMDFKDADGNVVASRGAASAEAGEVEVEEGDDAVAETTTENKAEVAETTAATENKAATSVPKTGVASLGLLFGLGAAVLGTGAVVLKKKEQ